MRRPFNFSWLLALVAGIILLSGVRSVYAQQTPAAKRQGVAHQAPIEVTLTAPTSLALHQPLQLTVDVMPLIDTSEVELIWVLPDGVTLLDGPVEENLGTMHANQTTTLARQIRIDTPGIHRIGVHAGFQPNAAVRFGDASVLYFTVDERGGSISKTDPQRAARLKERIPVGPDASVVVAADATPNATSAFCVDIIGRFTRKDKVFNGTTYDTIVIPVTGAVVEIWEDDVIFDDHYGTIMPDEQGNFAWTSCADDGLFGGAMEYYVKVVAKADGAIDEYVVEVESAPPLFIDLPDIPLIYSDPIYSFESERLSIDDVGTLDFGTMEVDEEKSAPLNIAETIFKAWKLWNDTDGDPNRVKFDDVDVYWSAGGGHGTYYVGILDNLYIQGEEPDEWDDSTIIHEWTHFADDKWGCDGTPIFESHTGFGLVDSELAWGEGYPDFYQSVVRSTLGQPFADHYIDLDELDMCGVCIDIENWHIDFPNELHINNEISNAAALWDLFDANNEGLDTVTMPGGHDFFGKVFISSNFTDFNIGLCDFRHYFMSWQGLGGPTDAAVAAAITQNTNFSDIFTTSAAVAAQQGTAQTTQIAAHNADAATTQTTAQNALATTTDFRWWQRVAYLIDNSASMAGDRLNAIKTVLSEQVDDLFAEHPKGVEFRIDTFNNASPTNQTLLSGQFFPNDIKPTIAAIAPIADPDTLCPVETFGALKQTVANQSNLDVWTFTDNVPTPTLAPLENFRAELVNRDISASFAILQNFGGAPCSPPPPNPQIRTRQLQFQRQWLFTAGNAPTEPDNSIVPYLLTAQATGGQFLFVEQNQMESAAQILQAQLSHNAGAGRWSDYVSLHSTYRYDELPSWEYEWIDGATVGTALPDRPGGLASEGYIDVQLPEPFTFYSRPVTIAHVYENGYLTFNDEFGEASANTQLPSPGGSPPNGALYPYWDDLEWAIILVAAQPDAPQEDVFGTIYTAQVDDWYVIEYERYWSETSMENTETFEVLLNLETGEIRYQYDTINHDVGSATIGLESWSDFNPIDGVQVGFNDANAASSGMGYRFIPVPPQPSKLYSVSVDSTMESIGFLLTGYSGDIAPIVVRPPGGQPVACNSAGVLCINVGKVQYVQVNVEDRTGVWTVEVTPGASGSGTYSFSSMAAGLLPANSPSDRTLPSFHATALLLNLGQPVDNNRVDAQLLTPANTALSQPFVFYDDGAHGDGAAGDGIFGSDPVLPQQSGTGYLWIEGELDGEPFRRVEPKPFSFQPIRLDGPAEVPALEAKTVIPFTLYNDDDFDHVFEIDVQVPQGWRGELDQSGSTTVTVGAGMSVTFPVAVWMGMTDQEALAQPTGASGTVNVAAIEAEQGALYDSATVQVTRRRPPAQIEIHTTFPFLQVNSSDVIHFKVIDEQNGAVVDGTELALSTTLGSLPATVTTINGIASAEFTAGNQTGIATITAQTVDGVSAQSLNSVSASTTVTITPPIVETILLSATATSLPADGESTTQLRATVLDGIGAPVPNQEVQIGVEGGGDQDGGNGHGMVNGSEVISGKTNANGEFVVTFTSGVVAGPVGVRAGLMNNGVAVREARIELNLLDADVDTTIYFPIIKLHRPN
jgi:hypothetical protein